MIPRSEIEHIVYELREGAAHIFPQERIDAVLFGSCARGDAEFGSDIDVLLLVDSSREAISERSWRIGDLAGELLMEHGLLVSPIVENREYFHSNAESLPLFRNIQTEGVKLGA